MARIRNPSANSAINPRKRSLQSFDPSPSPKRFEPAVVEWVSPPKKKSKVHWRPGSRIISGPSVMDPERRSQSPTRSALRKPVEDDHGHLDEADEHPGPSAQLQDDLCKADQQLPPVKTYRPTKISNAGARAGNATVKSKASKAKSRSGANTGEDGDEGICKQIDDLKAQIWDFAKSFPARPKKAKSDILSQLIQPQNERLVRYVGCIAMGGDSGLKGWQTLLTDDDDRTAVIWGVVGKALKENVFDELYFGAWSELESKLIEMEIEQSRQDGFYRQCCRSDEIGKQEAGRSRSEIDNALHKETARVALGLEHMLLPLWGLGDRATYQTWRAACMHRALFEIVLAAGTLARTMRRTRDVIYYWPPTLKDEEFEPARMECLNLGDMIRHSPYDRQEVQGRDRAVLREGHGDESQAIVRVVCFPGIQGYRQGGGELAKKQLDAERSGKNFNGDNAPPDVVAMRRRVTNRYGVEYTGNEGIRTRIISKGVVLLQWGQQRLLTKEAGTSIHIDAVKTGKMQKYEDDMANHVELFILFEERSSSRRASPVKPASQRSPSLMQRGINWFSGTAEEEYGDAGENRQREEGRLVEAPSVPRSRKGSRR